jgi:hypothetical protein
LIVPSSFYILFIFYYFYPSIVLISIKKFYIEITSQKLVKIKEVMTMETIPREKNATKRAANRRAQKEARRQRREEEKKENYDRIVKKRDRRGQTKPGQPGQR